MKIQEKDYYHGSALTQIVEHPSFTALNKANHKYGHYLINHNTRLLIKHCTSIDSPWSYTFQPNDLLTLKEDITSGANTYVCLICGLDTICILNAEQLEVLINLEALTTQWVQIEVRSPRGSLWTKGQLGTYRKAIPHNAFPDVLFE